jgi:putative ABC transport system permease protein
MTHFDVIPISLQQLAFSLLLILFVGLVTALLRLKLLPKLTIASVRVLIQLMLVGYVLSYIFDLVSVWTVIIAVVVMTVIAAHAAAGRARHAPRYPGVLSFFAMLFTTYFITFLIGLFIVRDDPWYHPRILIPLAGMLLSNTMNGIALSVDRYFGEIKARSAEVETLISLGATPWEAAQDCIREAMRTGLIPIMNTMMVAGIVSLPGMMTGQILGGVDPVMAVRYQIVIILMIAAAVTMGTLILMLATYRQAFTEDGALIPSLLEKNA